MMFICPECMKNFIDNSLSRSYGPCEICGKQSLCAEIPAKYLKEKPKVNDGQELSAIATAMENLTMADIGNCLKNVMERSGGDLVQEHDSFGGGDSGGGGSRRDYGSDNGAGGFDD